MKRKKTSEGSVSRRQFLITGGAAAAASGLPLIGRAEEAEEKPKIERYRTLGRTGFEVSDISIAVREGTDAIMLSGESAYGSFPFKSVDVMRTVATRTERA